MLKQKKPLTLKRHEYALVYNGSELSLLMRAKTYLITAI